MKQKITLWILLLSAVSIQAQSTSFLNDSIPVEKLYEQIEVQTSFKVFTTVQSSFKVLPAKEEKSSLEVLRQVLKETPYHLQVWGNYIFITEGVEMAIELPANLSEATKDSLPSLFRTRQVEKATSENRLYTIGEPYSAGVPAQVTLSGTVTDFKSGEPLSGINLILRDPWTATTTDQEGNFTLSLPTGQLQLEISGLNIKDSRRQLMLYSDGSLDIELEEEMHLLDEVLITSGRIENVKSTQLGMERIEITKIKNIPSAFGEVDILKAIQALPGVKTVGEASTGFNVRGGATDQNLILLNDGTIYNPNHLFGFFTAFSSEMIKEADIYKSSIPSKYGGRISSVLDISAREANKEKFTGSAGIGLVTSNVTLEVPLAKERTSILLSGRTTYSDWILKQLPEKSGYKNGKAGFYDLGTNFSHKFNDKNSLNVFAYYSRDDFSFNKDQKYAYSNMNTSAKWRSILNEQLVSNLTLGYDHYGYENIEKTEPAAAFKLDFNIKHFFAKADFIYEWNNKHRIDFGFKSMLYDISSGTLSPHRKESLVLKDKLQKDKGLENAFYIGDVWEVTPRLSVDAGIRYSLFTALGPRTYYRYEAGELPYESNVTDTVTAGSGKSIKTYHGPEFRLSARYAFTDNFSFKAGFNSMRQYIHKLSNTVVMSPTDTWKLSDANIKPQKGWQTAAGFYLNTPDGIWEYSVEGYYKKMTDYLDYRSGAKILMNHHIETDVINTEGYAYGVEAMIRKNRGRLNGWLSYTYSRTYLRQNDKRIANPVNGGKWYSTEYDKPHDLNFVGNYKFTQRYSISINVDYSTGRPTTIPAGQYYDHQLQTMRVYYTDRNSYRIPDYFRTDISFNIEPSHKLTLLTHSSISVGVYNATARKNVYSIYYLAEEGSIKGYKMSIFGTAIPFITYNIKF